MELDGAASRFFLQPDTTDINLQIARSPLLAAHDRRDGQGSHNGGTKLLPISDAVADAIGEIIIQGKDLPQDVLCHHHHSYMECLIDMECGWCIRGNSSVCVEGSASGPCNRSLQCPVYVTYQQEGIGSHDCGTNSRPCIDDDDGEGDVYKVFNDGPADNVPTAVTEEALQGGGQDRSTHTTNEDLLRLLGGDEDRGTGGGGASMSGRSKLSSARLLVKAQIEGESTSANRQRAPKSGQEMTEDKAVRHLEEPGATANVDERDRKSVV